MSEEIYRGWTIKAQPYKSGEHGRPCWRPRFLARLRENGYRSPEPASEVVYQTREEAAAASVEMARRFVDEQED